MEQKLTFVSSDAMKFGKWLITSPTPWKKSIELSQQLKVLWSTRHEDTSLWESIVKTKRIGYGCENLLERFINITDQLNLIKSRWQIQTDGCTVGEVDFLVRTAMGMEHWELGLKYYLYVPEQQLFIGSNGKDRLDIKLNKIETKQLPMGRHPKVLSYCQQFQQKPPLSRALIKGRLFFPKGETLPSLPENLSINPETDTGFWMRRRDLDDFIEDLNKKNMSYHILERYDWMSRDLIIINPKTEIMHDDQASFQLVTLTKNHDQWMEHERWVVVHNTFPKATESFYN